MLPLYMAETADRPAESKWLYNQPSEGIVKNWWERNEQRIRSSWYDPWLLDGSIILHPFFERWDGSSDTKYRADEVVMIKDGPEVPVKGSELWQIWQDYAHSEEAKNDFNGDKLHIHSYSPPLIDSKLILHASESDWWRMRTLGIGLREGTVPEHYRDDILPTQRENGFVFEGEHPNNIGMHGVIVTSDNHLVLTTRGISADYHGGTISASFEEQMDGKKDSSPFETLERAVASSGKLKVAGEELKLALLPETLRLGSIILEPDVNAIAMVIVSKCQELSEQIDITMLGVDRAEFDPKNPVWTLPLNPPETIVKQFFHPDGFRWHGTSRARIISALSYVYGYEETVDRLYQEYSHRTQS